MIDLKVLVVADSHMYRTPDGKTWCQGITGAEFFSRYTQVFEEVSVACRVQDVDSVDTDKFLRVDNEQIQILLFVLKLAVCLVSQIQSSLLD